MSSDPMACLETDVLADRRACRRTPCEDTVAASTPRTGLKRDQPSQHLDLRLQLPELGDNTFPLFQPQFWCLIVAALAGRQEGRRSQQCQTQPRMDSRRACGPESTAPSTQGCFVPDVT